MGNSNTYSSVTTTSRIPESYREDNRAAWNARTVVHATSPTYDTQRYVDDPSHLSRVVEFDRPRLPPLRGVRGIHLQCAIGTDTISLARLGAEMTGLDFSSTAISEARRLSQRCGTPVTFVESDVYSALDVLPAGSFDLVYTGVGALCWMPDIARWAAVVAGLLKPGGQLFVREGHPMLWTIDETVTDRLVVGHSYFEHEPVIMHEGHLDNLVQTDEPIPAGVTHEWNHGIGELITALLACDMTLTAFVEHDSAPWHAVAGQMSCDERGEWRLTEHPERLAATYTLQARRR